jgi:hypothetical protein
MQVQKALRNVEFEEDQALGPQDKDILPGSTPVFDSRNRGEVGKRGIWENLGRWIMLSLGTQFPELMCYLGDKSRKEYGSIDMWPKF